MSQRSILNETVLPEARRMVWNHSTKISGNFRATIQKEIQRVDGFDYRNGKIRLHYAEAFRLSFLDDVQVC